jgi:hypothetical protein
MKNNKQMTKIFSKQKKLFLGLIGFLIILGAFSNTSNSNSVDAKQYDKTNISFQSSAQSITGDIFSKTSVENYSTKSSSDVQSIEYGGSDKELSREILSEKKLVLENISKEQYSRSFSTKSEQALQSPIEDKNNDNQDIVKLSKSGNLCHAPGTTYYNRTIHFIEYKTLEDCLSDGGRLPKK